MNKTRLYYLFLMAVLGFLTGCPESQIKPPVKPPLSPPPNNPPKEIYDPEAAMWPTGWVPPKSLEDKNRWRGIIIHHSAIDSGNAADIDALHRQRGWDGIGYDFVIDNGNGGRDGTIEVGYRWKRQEKGAHCRPENCPDNYWNEHTIGICLIGNLDKYSPTSSQWQSLLKLVDYLQARYQIPSKRIIGHRDVPGAKTTCPGRYVSLPRLRQDLSQGGQ
jgi:hypothetical protein